MSYDILRCIFGPLQQLNEQLDSNCWSISSNNSVTHLLAHDSLQ